jgi:hypothetical protein
MSILAELNTLLGALDMPLETGIFSETPPDEYLVLTPMSAILDLYADNKPLAQLEEVRISLFTKNNYLNRRNQLTRLLLGAGFSITDRRYIGFEEDTKYHHYSIDVMMEYEMEVI